MIRFDATKPTIMGILNITPDSFSDGGRFLHIDAAKKQIDTYIKEGASIIDIGAQSTRPGAKMLSTDEELSRLTSILSCFKQEFDCILSLDTMNSDVAEFGLQNGVDMINDVSAMTADKRMIDVCKLYRPMVCLMHMQGTPQTMQEAPIYKNVVDDVKAFLKSRISLCSQNDITNIIIDPGIGFGKTLEHNLLLLNRLDQFLDLGCPLMVGTSRKSFINQIFKSSTQQRIAGTVASSVIAWQKGARFFRVHDVFECRQALAVTKSIEEALC